MAESSFRRRLLLQDHNTSTVDTSVYLTFVALENDLTVTFSNELQYFINGNEDWVTLPANTESPSINAGQTISFKANIVPVANNGVGRFRVSKKFEAIGDPRSLSHGEFMEEIIHGYLGISDYQFYKLFASCGKLIKVSKNFLPSTKLANHCYDNMFSYCDGLTTAPELPATTLADYCYFEMFYNCTSLTTAPELPATTLAYGCYYSMFMYCRALTKVPSVLPVMQLKPWCYRQMFYNCTSLTTAPELPATTLAYGCYIGMFNGCTSLTTAPELPATTLADSCYQFMFSGCTILTTAPQLLAQTLPENCYSHMFYYCSRLNYIKMMATSLIPNNSLLNWVQGVASTGTFEKDPSLTLERGLNGIPEGWTVVGENTGGGGDTGGGDDENIRLEWTVQSGTWIAESNSSACNGYQYTCESPGSDGSTVIRCTISGAYGASFIIRSQGESSYDYLNAGELDSSCTRDSYKTSLSGNQETDVEVGYIFGDYGTHYVEFCYSKDSSVDTPPDNGVVYLKELL